MSSVRSKNTRPELQVRNFLYHHGIRYRIHLSALPGKPDIAITSKKIVVEVKGCYWHRHQGCKYATVPKTNTDFYMRKFDDTVKRDEKNKSLLIRNGWKVIDVWECELKTLEKREVRLKKLLKELE